jgi:hypothetical protein
VAEVLVRFTQPTRGESGDLYWARAVGEIADDGLWDGWIEFSRESDNKVLRTQRETKQPNRADLLYWAEGLTDIYLEGALVRALTPPSPRPASPPGTVRPRSVAYTREKAARLSSIAIKTRVVLDPYVTYGEGEELLRKQLHALRHDHLQNIVDVYQMSGEHESSWARYASDDELVEHIIDTVRDSIR